MVCPPRGGSSICPFSDGATCLFERGRDVEREDIYQLSLMTGYGQLAVHSATGKFTSPLSKEGVLPPVQKQLLLLFMSKPGAVIHREEVLEEIARIGNSQGARISIHRLRSALGQPSIGTRGRYGYDLPTKDNNMLIQTISGGGNRLVMPWNLVAA